MMGLSQRLAAKGSPLSRVMVAFISLALLALLGAIGAGAWVTSRTQTHTYWVNHSFRVELAIDQVRQLVDQGETARRGFLLVSRPTYIANYEQTRHNLELALGKLDALIADNGRQRANIARLRAMIAQQVALRDRTIAMTQAGQGRAAIRLFRQEGVIRRLTAIRDQLHLMLVQEQRVLTERDADQRRSIRTFYTILTTAGALLLAVAIAFFVTISRYTRDLSASRDSLRELNETLEDQVDERTADLSRANEEIQRFAYIVSHDLRSPLVNVMGFTAELEAATATIAALIDRAEAAAPQIVTEDARLAAREDLPEAIGFIRTSTQKMDRLINAILKLSREGRRVIAPEPLDVTRMVNAIGETLAHRLDERGAELVVEALPPVTSDRLGLDQILSNLIENAVKYLQPGRPGRIVVRGHETAGRVVYDVEDNGRGIDPRDHARVFDLFRRSGQQDQPGEGIGLAHVRALAYRLGGVVDMRSELGQGTTFRVSLPTVFVEQGKAS